MLGAGVEVVGECSLFKVMVLCWVEVMLGKYVRAVRQVYTVYGGIAVGGDSLDEARVSTEAASEVLGRGERIADVDVVSLGWLGRPRLSYSFLFWLDLRLQSWKIDLQFGYCSCLWELVFRKCFLCTRRK